MEKTSNNEFHIDFKNAFDSVHRPSLWWILGKYGIPEDIITIIQNLYESRQSSVKWMGLVGDWFTVMTGVRQGCILSPTTIRYSHRLNHKEDSNQLGRGLGVDKMASGYVMWTMQMTLSC